MCNSSTESDHSGITFDQYLSLSDDTCHLASPVAATLIQTENRAEEKVLSALFDDLDAIVAGWSDESEEQIESAPAAPVAVEIEAPKVSVTTDQLLPDIAPAFRGDIARMPQLITRDEHRAALAERRAIDIIYLHRVGFRPTTLDTSIGDGRFRALMSGDTLDLALVREFATIVSSKTSRWSDEHLAEKVLFIPANLQVQLCQLSADRIKRGRARLHAEEAAIRVKLERSLRQSGDAKLIRHVPLWAKLATCDSLVKLAVNRRSPQEVSLLLKAMTGQDMARGNVSVALKAIDKHMA